MKTYFYIENKDFSDYLKLTTNNKTYYFCDDLTVELDGCDNLNIDIEYIKAEDYFKIKSQNVFLKLLLIIVKWIFSPLMFFIDNDDGIRLDKGYKSFNPFTYKKSFSINSANEKTININFIKAKYDKLTKKYTKPLMVIKGDDVIDISEETSFSSISFKQEWNAYHIPAYTVIMIFILLINLLIFLIFTKVIREMPQCPMSENIGAIVGISFCSIIMIALLVAYIVIIVKAHRLQKEVISKNA